MILVNLPRSWPLVLAKDITAEKAVLEAWHGLSEEELAREADVVLGVHANIVVAAYDITGWTWDDETDRRRRRVTFTGTPSKRWSHLVGTSNPGRQWGRQGDARPVQVVPTADVTPNEETHSAPDGTFRAVVCGFVVTVDPDQQPPVGTVVPPRDGRVVVAPASIA